MFPTHERIMTQRDKSRTILAPIPISITKSMFRIPRQNTLKVPNWKFQSDYILRPESFHMVLQRIPWGASSPGVDPGSTRLSEPAM
jgi:hypothetical protein